jgi:hypothetical protein
MVPVARRTSPRICACSYSARPARWRAEGVERAGGEAVPDHLLVEIALVVAVGDLAGAVVQAHS